MKKKRLIIGLSGASGAIMGIRLLQALSDYPDWESHLIISDSAKETINQETNYTIDEVYKMADYTYGLDEMGEKISSGTFKTQGMVIVPCSMKTLAGINSGYSDNLLLRAADVCIKEKRKLILVTRETPLSQIHLRNMEEVSRLGVIVLPPVLSFYNKPQSIDDMIHHIIGKILDSFDIELRNFKRWGEKDV